MTATSSSGLDFESWYRLEHPRLLAAVTVAAASLEVAQDVVGEAFSRALERWDRVSSMDSPTGWVRRVAFNVLRRRQRRAAVEARLGAHHSPPIESPTVDLDPDLWSAIASLPRRQRAVLGLRIVLDISQNETARLLGISEGTVSSTLIDARRNVARALAEPRVVALEPSKDDSD